jgi:hypothetical protein
MSIFTVDDGRVIDRIDFPFTSTEPLDRVRLLRDQDVGTIICGGLQDVLESMVRAHGIEVIAWVSGTVDALLGLYLRGQLVPGLDRTGGPDANPPTNPPARKGTPT